MIGSQGLLSGGIAATTSPVRGRLVAGYFTVFACGVCLASLRQALVPDRLLGRVGSAARLPGWGRMPLGPLIMGSIASRFGIAAPAGWSPSPC